MELKHNYHYKSSMFQVMSITMSEAEIEKTIEEEAEDIKKIQTEIEQAMRQVEETKRKVHEKEQALKKKRKLRQMRQQRELKNRLIKTLEDIKKEKVTWDGKLCKVRRHKIGDVNL